jgi:hypothetical protein
VHARAGVEYLALPPEALAALRECDRPCHRTLPNCSHLCPVVCHEGPVRASVLDSLFHVRSRSLRVARAQCPAPESCPKIVTVRCPCKRLKEVGPSAAVAAAAAAADGDDDELTIDGVCARATQEWPCSRVQASQGDRGARSLLLLPCDAACEACVRWGAGRRAQAASFFGARLFLTRSGAGPRPPRRPRRRRQRLSQRWHRCGLRARARRAAVDDAPAPRSQGVEGAVRQRRQRKPAAAAVRRARAWRVGPR